MASEHWEAVDGFPNYRVSDQGRVYNNKTKKYVGTVGETGYVYVGLSYKGNHRTRKMHQLVMEAFKGKCPEGCVIDHIDHNRANNKLSNLRYVTQSENNKNRGSARGISYDFIDELPEDAIKVDIYNGIEYEGYWYVPSQDKFYYDNGALFRSMHLCHMGNYDYIWAVDIYNKKRAINVSKWKREAGL